MNKGVVATSAVGILVGAVIVYLIFFREEEPDSPSFQALEAKIAELRK